MKRITKLPNFLCDTWWFALTQRISDIQFEKMAKLRASQGFTAIQLVVGIPPEVGPENQSALSQVGSAWSLKGVMNKNYLELARHRIQLLNSLGFMVIVYGAWGHQIEWLGVNKMKAWWRLIIKSLDKLNIIYCLTGEADIWIGEENKLLPDKSTDDFHLIKLRQFTHPKIAHLGWKIFNLAKRPLLKYKQKERMRKWSEVLRFVSSITRKPIIIHTTSTSSNEVVNNPQLLSAVTVQSGHSESSRQLLWKIPHKIISKHPKAVFINLEPWYEGIMNNFGRDDQIFAYWSSMMAGATAYCYGAHGLWNAGDGKFLTHWGKQTLDEALKLDTARLIGISHKLFINSNFQRYKQVEIETSGDRLIKISRSGSTSSVTYIPDVSNVKKIPKGKLFLPLKGCFTTAKPKRGSVVVIVTQ